MRLRSCATTIGSGTEASGCRMRAGVTRGCGGRYSGAPQGAEYGRTPTWAMKSLAGSTTPDSSRLSTTEYQFCDASAWRCCSSTEPSPTCWSGHSIFGPHRRIRTVRLRILDRTAARHFLLSALRRCLAGLKQDIVLVAKGLVGAARVVCCGRLRERWRSGTTERTPYQASSVDFLGSSCAPVDGVVEAVPDAAPAGSVLLHRSSIGHIQSMFHSSRRPCRHGQADAAASVRKPPVM